MREGFMLKRINKTIVGTIFLVAVMVLGIFVGMKDIAKAATNEDDILPGAKDEYTLWIYNGHQDHIKFYFDPNKHDFEQNGAAVSSNESVVTVGRTTERYHYFIFEVDSVGIGEADVTFTDKHGHVKTIHFNVDNRPKDIKYAEEKISMYLGYTKTLKYTTNPNTKYKPEFSSSNTDVITIDENGKMKAVGAGNATVSMKFGNFGIYNSIGVYVKNPYIKEHDNVVVGDKMPIKVVGGTEIKWTSSNTKIADFDKNGVLNAKKAGEITITGVTKQGATVKELIYVRDLSIYTTNNMEKISLAVGEKAKVETNTCSKTAKIYSSDKKVAKVDAKGIVTAVGAGKCKIYVKNGNAKAYINVSVKKPYLKRKEITLYECEIAMPNIVGKLSNKKYSSSDKKVATVSKGGIIKAGLPGKCKIYIKSGKTTLTLKVNVKKNSCTWNYLNIQPNPKSDKGINFVLTKAYYDKKNLVFEGWFVNNYYYKVNTVKNFDIALGRNRVDTIGCVSYKTYKMNIPARGKKKVRFTIPRSKVYSPYARLKEEVYASFRYSL